MTNHEKRSDKKQKMQWVRRSVQAGQAAAKSL